MCYLIQPWKAVAGQWMSGGEQLYEQKCSGLWDTGNRVRQGIIKGNTQIDPKMSKCTESPSTQATLKHKVRLPAKANFIKFTTRRSEATGHSHGRRRSSNAQRAKLIFLDMWKFWCGLQRLLNSAVACPGVILISLFLMCLSQCFLDYTSK